MKLHSFIHDFLIFLLITLFFLIPPFFVSDSINAEYFVWSFPFEQLYRFIIAFLLYYFYVKKEILDEPLKINKINFFYYILFPAPFCFGFLLGISLLIKACSILIPVIIGYFNEFDFNTVGIRFSESSIKKPDSIVKFLFCILNFFFSAFFEEVIYRSYFPDFLIKFLNIKNRKKIFKFGIEAIGMIVFAFSHLYMGFLSVINAAFAHVLLRMFYKKTGSIYSGVIAHFAYNIVSLYLL